MGDSFRQPAGKSLCLAVIATCFTCSLSAAEPVLLQLTDDYQLPDRALQLRSSVEHFELRRQDYAAHRAVEWQVLLNPVDTAAFPAGKFLDDLLSADFELVFPEQLPVHLHWNKGSHSQSSDFQPFSEQPEGDAARVFESVGGRSSDGVMPYFNLSCGHGGLIFAVGWSGDWRVTFRHTGSGRVRVTAGLKHSRILADNTAALRFPSVLIMSYEGTRLAGQNQFRRLMLQHFTPQNHAPSDLMPVAASVHGMIGFNDTTEDNLRSLLTDIAALKLPIDTFWLDAGWNEAGFPAGQGNVRSDPIRFPAELVSLGQAVKAHQLRFLVWYEPERIMRGTQLFHEHPEWLLKPTQTPPEFRYLEQDGFHLLDFSNSDARRWVTDYVATHVSENHVGIYRQDANLSPGYFWHTGVTAEQAAMREVRYVNGLYAFLDELVERRPDLIIDNCAAGGRRLDFEMMRRSVVLWRSDSCWGDASYPRNVQAMTHGLSLWLPLHGLGAAAADETALKSGMGACASFAINYRDPQAIDSLRRHLSQYLPVRHLFMQDFFPLTEWTEDPHSWLAFQFHDPKTHEGLVQAFRRPSADVPSLTVRLHGLTADKTYQVFDWNHPEQPLTKLGSDLMNAGMELNTPGEHGTVVLQYRPVKPVGG